MKVKVALKKVGGWLWRAVKKKAKEDVGEIINEDDNPVGIPRTKRHKGR